MAEIGASAVKKFKRTSTIRGYTYGNDDLLGSGSFGVVFKATNKYGNPVAIKVIDYKHMKSRNAKKEAKKEVHTLKSLRHDNIISIWDDFEFPESKVFNFGIKRGIAIVTHYCSNGSLHDYLKYKIMISEEQRLNWYKQLLSALEYIHSKNFAHRDLKPGNILVDASKNLKVADVGLAKEIITKQHSEQETISLYMTTMCGTFPFMAPEVFDGRYTDTSDIFSMGLVMYVICQLPPNLHPQVKADKIDDSFRFKYHEHKTPALGFYYQQHHGLSYNAMEIMEAGKCLEDEKDIFNSMLQPRKESRPTAAEVLQRLEGAEKERKRQQEEMQKLKLKLAEAEKELAEKKLAEKKLAEDTSATSWCVVM